MYLEKSGGLMREWRLPPSVSTWLIGLGLLLSLAVAVSALTDVMRPAPEISPFDQTDDSYGQDSMGFVPYFVPEIRSGTPARAPTLSPPLVIQASVAQQAPAASGVGSASEQVSVLQLDKAEYLVANSRPQPTATPAPIWRPDRLVIPAIQLDAPVVSAKLRNVLYQEKLYQQWLAPYRFAAGQLPTSAALGASGNTVLIGHHNKYGEVFGHLVDLKVDDLIWVYAGNQAFAYTIAHILILPERFQSLTTRLSNAEWIGASSDERLTLVTCWPTESNTHRLIIVAKPIRVTSLEEVAVTPRLTPRPTLVWEPLPTVTLEAPLVFTDPPLPIAGSQPEPSATSP